MGEHKNPPHIYAAVFGGLVGLTGLTVWLGSIDLGQWHTAVGLTVATVKAVLIGLFFMHLLHGSRITWAIMGIAVLFLAILLMLTLTDYLSRGWPTGRTSSAVKVWPFDPAAHAKRINC